MKKRLKVGVLFGGKSAEHEVSIASAQNIINALDKKKYQITPIKINKNGEFNINNLKKFDVIFPVLHGPFGEDGSVQGLLKILNLPFVGAGILGSAVGMDKDIMKRLLREAKIPIPKSLVFHKGDVLSFAKIKKILGLPLFIKPANMGSSVGISKVSHPLNFNKAIKKAFQYDTKIIIEEFIDGREVECSVLGNENPIASVPGEIITSDDFYSYEAKYITASTTVTNAKFKPKTKRKIQELAIRAYQTLNCEGMGRVDFLLRKNDEVLVNEINTIPGFTDISMYPKLWEATGLSQTKLLDRLIDLAIERFERERKLKTTFK
ncbi:D-alanine--D-alanine ligase A [Candidatus Nomurabacteria bacterium CG10_big_fil_rev_8_21_14_0_10_35_16]|uniref:D-alanine--D-alanine ligase n=1 Tax=Candidatus Nomurabacteria bacterium CG10_big_fil_rev_8_21_14_0_10_35_16 TaxID=1974731 RepID=A0A2H0TCM2_9BACT|nr:MAG: D-alanine--D-alanine ligase A [Candidatus Nomurabacteria bacterium CG10_big_fil_rev_8_21_14_0_10_35_16]